MSDELNIDALADSEDFERDLQWAYSNLGKDLLPDPPSSAAQFILEWAVDNRSTFISTCMKYFTSDKRNKGKETERALEDDKRQHFKRLDKLEPRCPHCKEVIG